MAQENGNGGPVAETAERAADSRTFERIARLGYVASGIVHVVIGAIALQIDAGRSGNADTNGAVAALAHQPAGYLLLWFCFIGCFALALFQFSRIFLAGQRLSDKELWKDRARDASQAIVYAGIGSIFGSFALGRGSNDGSSSSVSWTARLLAVPAGQWLLGIAGLVVVGIGGYFIFKGATRRFRGNLTGVAGRVWNRAVDITGVAGYIAKGISLVVLGILLTLAAVKSDPEQSTGLDGALHTLRDQPFGVVALAAVGIGLMLYGLYIGIIRARFAKL
ncbi:MULTISPECIES: DUF1206 domain-containing protein [unclassified Arthrobacter]|uniref:DUF1206 domain-containing protein n=1 Tax=unclassified Arthrobacter TaxID=235627 RepID=UPI001D14F228|nr:MULTISPECIES: DUF1206 domain-containing protein [unclassified Arthrobacter]MCC3275693.1 DUF1206 domain-containing protein [Arthrobacter sp. zg-Y20]MCC3278878.1 DUF1206 domain-containing protein [Arthrobacter sp. zg-Y40]MCC9177256.1 DUF1206 domain-containing protein [Arthrobacter sp. zg-Y750]MDK1315850.1 DUF1206 domain-containing protein [Arthrobacter sp. zg.Y20]MDK1326050.1 DUF1206 domain-containing protein [Arthrobacter sp. zg-Y1143]